MPAQQVERTQCRLVAGGPAGEHQPHDRLGAGVEAQEDRRLRLQRQAQHLELVAHLQAGLVHVGAPGELQHDVALAGARNRTQPAQVLDHADRFLHRLRDQRLDLRRCRSGVLGAHGERWIAQVRQQVDLEVAQRDQPEQDERQRDHGDGDASPRGELDQAAARARRSTRVVVRAGLLGIVHGPRSVGGRVSCRRRRRR
jgi:hypothetical protein